MVAVATATETAAAGAATTAAGAPTTATGAPTSVPGVGADGIAFAPTAGAATTAECAATSAASTAWSARRFGRGVAHIAQFFPPLVGGGACPTFPVRSRGGGGHDKRVVGAGCDGCLGGCACWFWVCCAPLLFCLAYVHKCTKKSANQGIFMNAGKLSMRQTKLLHLIEQIFRI
jgi:hypothetical protein